MRTRHGRGGELFAERCAQRENEGWTEEDDGSDGGLAYVASEGWTTTTSSHHHHNRVTRDQLRMPYRRARVCACVCVLGRCRHVTHLEYGGGRLAGLYHREPIGLLVRGRVVTSAGVYHHAPGVLAGSRASHCCRHCLDLVDGGIEHRSGGGWRGRTDER